MTIEEALEIIKTEHGDPLAWEVLVSSVYQPLLAYVTSLLLTFRVNPSEAAPDIVHEVLIAWFERWPADKLQDITTFSSLNAYLRASCRNLLIDKYRHERRATQLRNFLTLKFESAFQDESDLYRSLFLNEIIKIMPEKCATLFRIYVTEDLSPAEIADRLGESPSKFNSRWYRCIGLAKEIFLKRKATHKRF